jgi:GTP-binding protein HflX
VPDPLAFAARIRDLYPGSVVATVMRTDGLQSLKTALAERAAALRPTFEIEVPVTDGARLAALYRAGEVISREDRGESVVLTIRTDAWRAEQLRDPDGNGRRSA